MQYNFLYLSSRKDEKGSYDRLKIVLRSTCWPPLVYGGCAYTVGAPETSLPTPLKSMACIGAIKFSVSVLYII